MKKRRIAIAVGAVILVAGVVAGRERPAVELVQERAPRVVASADDGIDLGKLQRGESSLPQTDPFRNFETPKSAAAKSPVEKPAAPPLPFQYFGRLTENGKSEVYVMRGQDLLTMVPGLDLGDYRVDQVSDTRITFTYVPLKTKQTLDIPAVN